MAVSLVSTGVTFPDSSTQITAATGFGFKNRIINGAMVIDQRNAGASVTPANNAYTLDRWFASLTQASKFTVQRNAGGLSGANLPTGFLNYFGCTSSSAYSVLTADTFLIRQGIEGFNVADLGWGTANASTVTLSFWVRSSLTGSFGGSLNNVAGNRFYPFSYTISTANTWEQKSITIAGETSGTWATDNTTGISLNFNLGTGSSLSGTAGAWTSTGTPYAPTGATSVVGTNGATFYITGVQLEKGSTATSFDYRPYGAELALCQRYYRQTIGASNTEPSVYGYALSGTNVGTTIVFPVPMRTTPTISIKSGSFTVVNCASPSYIATSDSYLVFSNATANGATHFQSGTAIVKFDGVEL